MSAMSLKVSGAAQYVKGRAELAAGHLLRRTALRTKGAKDVAAGAARYSGGRGAERM